MHYASLWDNILKVYAAMTKKICIGVKERVDVSCGSHGYLALVY